MTEYQKFAFRRTFYLCRFCKDEISDGEQIYDIGEIIGATGFIHKKCLASFIDFNKSLVFGYLEENGSLQKLLEMQLEEIKYDESERS